MRPASVRCTRRTAGGSRARPSSRRASRRSATPRRAIGAPDVRVRANPAISLRADLDEADAILSRLCPERGTPLVAVCLRNWMQSGAPGQWERQVAQVLDAFIEHTGAFVVFVPFQ